jgi:hypothetical protein
VSQWTKINEKKVAVEIVTSKTDFIAKVIIHKIEIL